MSTPSITTGINLIPLARLQQRRMAARIRTWLIVAPLCASMLAGAYAWLRATWTTDVSALAQDIESDDKRIQSAERELASYKARIAELLPNLRAARAVGDQPDWGLLLTVVAHHLRGEALLSSCTLTPATDQPAPPAGKPGKADSPKPRDPGARPERFTLALSGLAQSQDAVSGFVAGLEATGVFDRVALAESRRAALGGQEAIAFRVECQLIDPLTEAP